MSQDHSSVKWTVLCQKQPWVERRRGTLDLSSLSLSLPLSLSHFRVFSSSRLLLLLLESLSPFRAFEGWNWRTHKFQWHGSKWNFRTSGPKLSLAEEWPTLSSVSSCTVTSTLSNFTLPLSLHKVLSLPLSPSMPVVRKILRTPQCVTNFAIVYCYFIQRIFRLDARDEQKVTGKALVTCTGGNMGERYNSQTGRFEKWGRSTLLSFNSSSHSIVSLSLSLSVIINESLIDAIFSSLSLLCNGHSVDSQVVAWSIDW